MDFAARAPLISSYFFRKTAPKQGFFFGPQVPEPDLLVIALDHPAFATSQKCLQLSLEEKLETINEIYGEPKEGNMVTLVEAEDDRIVEMFCLQVRTKTVVVGLQASDWRLAGKTSVREVPKEAVFLGFPCIAVVPSMPLRLLKLKIAGGSSHARGMWPEYLNPSEVRVEVNGEPITDEEYGVGKIMELVLSPRANVDLCVGYGWNEMRIPWVAKEVNAFAI